MSTITMGFQSAIDVKPLLRAVKKANKLALTASAKEVKKEAKSLLKQKARGTKGRDKAGRFKKAAAASSKPGQPPAKKRGNLYKSIKHKVGKTVAWVGATKPGGAHGQLMTWGRSSSAQTGKMLPRLFMQPALDNVRAMLPAKWKNKL